MPSRVRGRTDLAMNEKQMTAREWLQMRAQLAGVIREGHSRMEQATAVKLAEHLILAGVIDFAGLRVDDSVEAVSE